MNLKQFDIEYVCKKLHHTYNTNYLNTIPIEIQKVFSDTIKEYIDTGKGNTTLIKLIYNNFFNTKPMYQTISGPMSFYHLYSKEHQKIIYMFGEHHGRGGGCEVDRYDITQYLSELFETTNVFIDFFIEVPIISNKKHYYNKNKLLPNSYINDLFLEFSECIEPANRQQNKCSLSRVHYIDIRKINYKEYTNATNIFGFFERNIQTYLILDDFNELPDIIKKMLLFFENNSSDTIIDYILSEYSKNYFLNKNIKKSYMNNEIGIFIYNILKTYVKLNLPEIKQLIDKLKIKKNIEYQYILQQLNGEFIHINHYLIDWYTLARIYKKVENLKFVFQPSEPRNIIIYAGNNHIKNYLDFFQSKDYVLVESEIQKDIHKNRCLDMKNIKQPLFN
jgi:hypothetical protein